MNNKHVAVIGAGITGITTAYYLAKLGYKVSVIEQEKYPAMRTSFANGGQVSTSNSEVWTTWPNIIKGLKWMLKKDAPLLIHPTLDWSKIKWLFRFLKSTINNEYYENTNETIRMGLESRALYKEIIQSENLEFDQSKSGILHFYKNEEYWNHARKVQTLYEDAGCEFKLLGRDQVKHKDPALYNLRGVIGGAWTTDDWTGDIHKFCNQLAQKLKTKYNVNFYFLEKVYDLQDFAIDFDCVVVSAGVGSVELAKSINEEIPIYPVKGYSITITVNDEKSLNALPKVSLLDDEAKIVTSTLGNRFRVAGTAELNGENYDIVYDRIKPLLNWVHYNFPEIDTRNYSSFACLRPMTPNMMPITKQSDKNKKIFYNTGHGHLGWTLAPYTAKKITEYINATYQSK